MALTDLPDHFYGRASEYLVEVTDTRPTVADRKIQDRGQRFIRPHLGGRSTNSPFENFVKISTFIFIPRSNIEESTVLPS